MSQSGPLSSAGAIPPHVETITGNSGGPVGPDGSNNINIVGNNTTGIDIVGNAGLNTLTVIADQATTTQFGTVELATNAQAIAGTDTNNAVTSSALSAKLGTQTAHTVAIFEGSSSALSPSNVGTNGQVLIAATGADPAFASLTSSDSSITFTTGANTLSLQVAGGTTVGKTITGNTGGALSPTAGNWNILGTGSITAAGSGSTLTVQLTGLTNHALQIGAGTATLTQLGSGTTGQVLQTNTTADPTWSTATYPSTTTINQILYSSVANTVTGLATANRAVLTTGATGVPVLTALATDGQVIIGSTAGAPAAATLTPGTGISITNGSNSITIAATAAGFAWSDQSGAFAAVKENGYFITGTATATLPASPTEGDTIAFIVDTTQILTIQANTGQLIRIGTTVSASAGTCVSNFRGDSIELVYRSTGTTWFSLGAPEGTWTIT